MFRWQLDAVFVVSATIGSLFGKPLCTVLPGILLSRDYRVARAVYACMYVNGFKEWTPTLVQSTCAV